MIKLTEVSKLFIKGDQQFSAIKNINLEINEGDFILLVGPSGCGKTSLLNILGLLSQTTSGEYWLNDILMNDVSPDEKAKIRNQKIGFVFQSFNLLNEFNVLDNVSMPMGYAGINKIERIKKAEELLYQFDMLSQANKYPHELSGGQQQRVAIARALSNNPLIVLADEPTGNLDSNNSKVVMEMFKRINENGTTVIMSTHDLSLRQYGTSLVYMKDGEIIDIEKVSQ